MAPERPPGPAGGGIAEGDLELALLKVCAVIGSTVANHRAQGFRDRRITAVEEGSEAIMETARELVTGARTGVDIRLVGDTGHPERLRRRLQELVLSLQGPARVRLLCSPSIVPDEAFVREQVERGLPIAVRVARFPPLQALIVDGSAALVAAESAVGRRASVIRVPEVIHTLHTLFDGVWRNALPADERVDFDARAHATPAARILGALRAGVTDEVAARELAVSVRTFRRHVAEIMNQLGARSRFQAGVRAAELGLLPLAETPEVAVPDRRRRDTSFAVL
ncbi:LuxR family transcriptional regulator [Streptomyces sannanensis]|uniref:LuxR family transcriptional regulator n=1 Tax=Streptomyces sannanensis TaxID=285536 RepID=UPI0031EFB30F